MGLCVLAMHSSSDNAHRAWKSGLKFMLLTINKNIKFK